MVPATYVPLPKDYTPFAPFSDGGLLIHSGRFQACASRSVESEPDCDGPWPMEIEGPPDTHILLKGQLYRQRVDWIDSNDGTKIYIGTQIPEANELVVALVDEALPDGIRQTLAAVLPEIMGAYSKRLPPLERKPMLFISYDPAYGDGYGNQGGTLPDQVFMHYYGSVWASNGDGSTREDTAWFFAHEIGHLFQHGAAGTRDASWIHEGAAEAFAFLVLRSLEAVSESYLEARRQAALDDCVGALHIGALAGSAQRGAFSDYYACGLIFFLAIDDQIQARAQGDLFDFWSDLISQTDPDNQWDAVAFAEALETWTGKAFKETLLEVVHEEQQEPSRILIRLSRD